MEKPIPTEMPQVAKPQKEKPVKPTKETKTAGKARKQLEDIAAGKPVLETVAEQMISHEQATQLLNEANALLLDMKDVRLLISSLATQAADSPLGHQMQMETLKMLKEIPTESVPPEFKVFQQKLAALPISEQNPAENPLISTIQQYNITHPDSRVPEELLSQIQNGDAKSPELIAEILQSNQPLAQIVWKELTNSPDEFKGFNPTHKNMLDLAGFPHTKENLQKAEAIFAAAKPLKEKPDMTSKLASGMLMGALTIMFVSQMATNEPQQSH